MIINILAVIGAITVLGTVGCCIALYMIISDCEEEDYESESDLYEARTRKIYDELRNKDA